MSLLAGESEAIAISELDEGSRTEEAGTTPPGRNQDRGPCTASRNHGQSLIMVKVMGTNETRLTERELKRDPSHGPPGCERDVFNFFLPLFFFPFFFL